MLPGSNVSLALIIISLGFLGVILSFLVPDKKKSNLSLLLAVIVIIAGGVQLGQESMSKMKLRRQMKEVQRERQVDLEEIRKRLRQRAAENNRSVGQSTGQ